MGSWSDWMCTVRTDNQPRYEAVIGCLTPELRSEQPGAIHVYSGNFSLGSQAWLCDRRRWQTSLPTNDYYTI